METDRRGSTFYFPDLKGIAVLNQIGSDADSLSVAYGGHQSKLAEAYREFATSLSNVLQQGSSEKAFGPFIYPSDQ